MKAKNNEKRKNNQEYNQNYSNDDYENESWLANGLHKFIIAFTIAWFGIVLLYANNYGWDNIYAMEPNEFSGNMAGVTLPLAIFWVIMAYIDRGSNFKKETKMLRDSLNQVIFPDSNGNMASKMIADAIKEQVADLKDITRDACAQADVIKRDLSERVIELKDLVGALDNYSSKTMLELNDEVKKMVENFSFIANKAASTTSDFRVHTMQMREDSEKIVNTLTPIVNEMVTAAEKVKEVVDVNNENIIEAKKQLNEYSESSRLAIGTIIESWAEKGEELQKTYLRTAENCEEMFRRLDSGISHIESSIAEQKKVVDEQSDILNKNSTYLDSRLGEYGKLISIEIEAMVERSNTVEHNLQTQMKDVKNTAQQVNDIFNQLGINVSDKRKLIENESLRVMNSINLAVNNFEEEIKRLKSFYENAQGTSGEMNKIFASVTENLKNIETGLSVSLENFSNKSQNIVTQFNDLGSQINNGMSKLVESSENISNQSKVNTDLLTKQDEYVNQALSGLKQISSNIGNIGSDLKKSTNSLGETLTDYENKITSFNQTIDKQMDNVKSNYDKTQKQLDDLDKRTKQSDIDMFMKNSADIITELETISVDINGIFNRGKNDDALWKKFYEGDRGIFIRNLSKNMTKKEIVAIREDYEQKADFRVIVDKYLSDFDVLIAAAEENNRSGTLLATISGSDIGKVYYIIAKALGKVK